MLYKATLITIENTGFRFEGKLYPWTTMVEDVDLRKTPTPVQMFIYLNTAQTEWERVEREGLRYMTQLERCQRMVATNDPTTLAWLVKCGSFSARHDAHARFMAETLMQGEREDLAGEDTVLADFYRSFVMNSTLVHFLFVLHPKYVHLALAALGVYPQIASMHVPSTMEIEEEDADGFDWLKDPIATKRKVRFDRTIGKLVEIK